MKGRSYRFPTTEPHEDWVDGSWTVDCVCGVNFDDGEEMVNCDECGVWVHTRCSRYVKGEELFTCDKCKSKNNANDSEETEVAQLLVELPTKTLGMENSYGRGGPLRGTQPVRLWTEIPMEERVHVQGIPGGEPTLFEGLSSVFSRELWKCTGYVPKKINFTYRDFPCWDKEENDEAQNACETGRQDQNRAGVQIPMSKEDVVAAPASALVSMRSLGDKETDSLKLGEKETKRWDSGIVDTTHSQSASKIEKSLLRPLLTNKRKKELFVASKDRMKKKVKLKDKEADEKNFVRKTAFRATGDSKPSESRKDRNPEGFVSDVGSVKSEKSKENILEDTCDRALSMSNGGDDTSNTAIAVECSRDVQPPNVHAHGAGKQDDRVAHHVRIVLKTSTTNDSSSLEGKNAVHIQAKEERKSTMADTSEDKAEGSPGSSVKPSAGCPGDIVPGVEDEKLNDVCGSSSYGNNNVQKEMGNATASGTVGQQALDHVDSKDVGTGASDFNKMKPSGLLAADQNMQSLDMSSERVSSGNADKADELSSHSSRVKREVVGSEVSMIAQKDTLESKPESCSIQEQSKSCKPPVPGTVSGYSRPKVVVCIGKSSSSATTEKPSGFDNLKHTASESSIPGSKHQPSDGHVNGERERASIDVVRERDRDDFSGKASKEHPKHSTSSKSAQQGRVSHSSVSKRNAQDPAASSTSKASSAHTNGGSADAAGLLLNQHSSRLQNKQSPSGVSQKGDKSGQPIFQSSSKSPTRSTNPAPNSGAPLSDEELALLLHQELNSSPRVPRVPRMRQPGSLPQLASPAATSLLIKRTSSSGSKDHGWFSRRRSKDISKDGFRASRDADDKGTKSTKLRYSPDRRAQDSGNRGSVYTKGEESETPRTSYSARKVLPPSSTTSTSSGPCSSNELNEHSMPSPHSSPRNTSDGGPLHQTLPGLINEIMSKGKRMTYEELCNAVLPHWPHLRKHNGERYAYSSHSQAVLDCLRNRHEWARLVDRGPKTNSSRKKRKADAEETDENKRSKGREMVEEEEGAGKRLRNSHGDDFPKGKRKARKRRRLALQGKGVKDLRKKRNEEVSEEDAEGDDDEEEEEEEDGAFSDSSEESVSTEEDDDDRDPGGADVSSGSDDTETTS